MLKNRSATFLLITAIFFLSIKIGSAASPVAPTNLRIQDNTEQLGIDRPNPRFAWYVNDPDRGESQTAYRIIVSSSRDSIDAGTGDMWDAGKVVSCNQYGVKYAGAPLQSNTKYWWKVMTWDKDNNPSPWSLPVSFITGFMNDGAWSASWINAVSNTVSVPYMLRKEFSVSKAVEYATANVCGLGQFELYLNGAKVGDHELDPGWTDYKKTQQYVTFDVTSRLRNGNNAVGIWLADGFMDLANPGDRYAYFTHSDGAKRMIMELNIRYTDGTTDKIKSDASWKVSTGEITYAHTFGGEDHDALQEKTGWTTAGYNDSSWRSAVVTTSPGGSLIAQSQPPVKVVETLTPASMIQTGSSVRVDFGKTYAGIFEIMASGTAGQKIIITMSEDNSKTYKAYCQYTLKGAGVEVFRPKFWYFGQKYITIQNASLGKGGSLPFISSVRGYVLSNSAKTVGSFSSSSDMMKKVFAINRQGFLSNMYSFITDCPHREKSPWMNDINFTSPSYTVLFDVQTLFGKICRDITDSQYANGMLPSLAPQYQVWKGPFLDAPFYGISAMRFPWLMYQKYGDTDVLQKQYAVAKNALANITSHASGNLVSYGLGDWLSPDPVSTQFVETCVYYDFVDTMQKWAAVIHNIADANEYSVLAGNIKNAFNAKYWNSTSHNYGSQQTANAVPLCLGMQPAGEEHNVLAALVASVSNSNYHINCGQNGHGAMLQALSKYGRDDLIARIHANTTGPGFGYWVTQGKSNTPEKWDGGGSQQHQMNNVIPEWFCCSLAGIRNATPGFGEIVIRPASAATHVPDAVTYSLETVRGVITSSWSRSASQYTLSISIPVNCTSKVFIPTFGLVGISIREGGTVLWSNGSAVGTADGVHFDHLEGAYPSSDNFVVFSVGSGSFNFISSAGLTQGY